MMGSSKRRSGRQYHQQRNDWSTGGTIGPGGTVSGSIGATGGLSSPGGAGGTNISGTGGTIGSGWIERRRWTDGSTVKCAGASMLREITCQRLTALSVGPPACPAPTFPCEAGYQ